MSGDRVTAPFGPSTPGDAPARLDPRTRVGAVALTVSDLDRSRAFYERVLGLQGRPRDRGELGLGPVGADDLVILRADPSAPRRDPCATGLFHLALLVPTRADLACALRRVAASRWPLTGASDHLVSEALYLRDPDDNGIEIYRDRPREQWPRDAAGAIVMATLALDLEQLAADVADVRPGTDPTSIAPGTQMGHVHLQVDDLTTAEAFYVGVLGFDAVIRGPGALFVSAGGYHHHIGVNTWQSAGGRAPAPGAVGLRWFEMLAADQATARDVLARASAAGVESEPTDRSDGRLIHDPSGIAVLLRTR